MPDILRSAWSAFTSIPNIALYLTLGWLTYLVWLGLWIVLQKREPVATLSWLISLAALPYIGSQVRRIAGTRMESEALAQRLLKGRSLFEESGGGVTFSGGEPLMQWPFVKDVIAHLQGVHCAVETSGFVSDAVFGEVMSTFNLIMMDIKLTDPARHKHFTGVDNAPILRHADMLREGNTPFIIRMPLIPGVNDEPAHFEAVAARIEGARALQRVEFLPYHKTAGAKYSLVGMKYSPEFDVNRPVQIDPEPFNKRGIPVVTL